jgi:putative transposase
MIGTYQYRLFANKTQDKKLDYILEQQCWVYNEALAQRRDIYQETGKGVSYYDQWPHFRDMRRENPDTLGQINASSMQQLLRRVDKAFKAFFRRVKAGETPGYPRFKSRKRFRSMEYRYGDGCKLIFEQSGQVRLRVQNVGQIKVKYHRSLPEDAQIKHVVLKKNLGKWYLFLMLDIPDPQPLLATGQQIGIDMGLRWLLALSDGTIIENPRWYQQALKRLRIMQRKLSRQKTGGYRWRKTCFQIAKLHHKIANQRRDFWHQWTGWLVKTYDLIAIENLSLSFMIHNQHLAQSVHDAGLAEFRDMLMYKAEEAGTQIIAVNPVNTSQQCSGCGIVVEKGLSVRVHRCDQCALVLDRDVNAARNILALGLSVQGQT